MHARVQVFVVLVMGVGVGVCKCLCMCVRAWKHMCMWACVSFTLERRVRVMCSVAQCLRVRVRVQAAP